MTAANFSRRSWSETTAGGGAGATSGDAGLCEIDAVVVEFKVEERGVDAPVAVAVESDDESQSLPMVEARIMACF